MTLNEALAVSGASYQQLDCWATVGYLRIPRSWGDGRGRGYSRDWPADEVAIAAAMARLIRLGMMPGAAHRVARSPHVLIVLAALEATRV